jgi:hypothetical protein
VRDQVAEASIVVAIISPTFQSRPFCVAELGAAWSRVGNLFPIAVPGMPRTDLEGVLEGMLVKYLDGGSALDELHSRISEALGHTTDATTWGRFRAKWLANVASYVDELPAVRVLTPTELDRLEKELAGTSEALSDSEAERRKLKEQVQRLSDATSAAEVTEILLPDDEFERFEQLRSEAASAMGELDTIVGEAMWYDLFEGGMPWPDGFEDRRRLEQAESARREGALVENSSELLEPDQDLSEVTTAYEAVYRLRRFIEDEISEAFHDWFREQYGMSPDLRKKRLWDDLMGTSKHLACLHGCGLVERDRRGREVYYALADGVDELLGGIDWLLERVGDTVAGCELTTESLNGAG